MLNSLVVVGRLYDIYDTEHILLKIPSTITGEDIIIKVKTIGSIRENMEKYCQIGDLVGIRGHFIGIFPDNDILAEKITFLSGKNESN